MQTVVGQVGKSRFLDAADFPGDGQFGVARNAQAEEKI